MRTSSRTDEDLLGATDASSFEEFYLRHVDTVLGYFARRTGDAELAADLRRRRSRPRWRAAAATGRARARAARGCSGSRRASSPTRSARATRSGGCAGGSGWSGSSSPTPTSRTSRRSARAALLEGLSPTQAEAVRAHVIEERDYGEIAGELDTSEAVVRKRVSRGLATARRRIGRQR